MRRRLRLAAVGLVLLALGCGSERREAASLVAAVDRYRKAEMAAKAPLAGAIAAVVCTDATVCSARDACLAAARPTVEGTALKREVEASLADLRAGKITQEEAATRGLPQKLDEAGQLLEEGRAKIGPCDEQTTALRRKFEL